MIVDYRTTRRYLANYEICSEDDFRCHASLGNQIPSDHLVMEVKVEVVPIPKSVATTKQALECLPGELRLATLVEFLTFESESKYLENNEGVTVVILGTARKCQCCDDLWYPCASYEKGHLRLNEVFCPNFHPKDGQTKWRLAAVRKSATKLASF